METDPPGSQLCIVNFNIYDDEQDSFYYRNQYRFW
ncbi:hypothetical protein J2Y45_003898 [Dyadobacter sp. BE34]|uniref:Uncharacterized protein n=1 Tax=Dyadobacter fermentans TaxID=94254 RepID=A0ABU1QZX0_9BACT|nr:hypothetical protein [Dyadobacter fermentans]MDR7044448.1 hypothetical protein [Dyadobacter sp. BE242]MDR7198758.1 hypothetical protein [Dyadobacter sp. BE34]MDR7216720.1 hypothetical protein [Dyadobacter sp. BE31]MDR7263754.1 hypothetical protein [Dyadobacter sp. BE32]